MGDTEQREPRAHRVLGGRYALGELIGRGGMAEVHAAWDTRLGREVAVKVLRSDLARDPSFLQRFRREAQSAAGLNHPGVVAVYDSGEDVTHELGGAELAVPYIVMELVQGQTLREMLHARGGPLDPLEACRLMAETLRALAYSHANGLIHRDIKPANIMVTRDGEVKLTDFGIARAVADSAATLTNTSVVVGTAQYLSPEQAQGRVIDARADAYAAGCVLYELLTGRPPFTGDSPLAIAYQQVGQAPEPPSTLVRALGREIDAVVLHALEKDPEDRYASAGEFAADLEAIVRGTTPSAAALAAAPIEAPEPAAVGHAPEPPEDRDGSTTTLPAIRPQRRHRRGLFAGLAALVVVLLAVFGVLAAQGRFADVGGVTVPDVRQKTLRDAQDQLAALGLAADVRRVPNQAPQDIVVRQSPDGGQHAEAGSRVRLDVSSGPDNVVVPNLYNYDQASARAKLEDLGLSVTFEQVDSVEIGAGKVTGTEPKAAATVQQGARVTLLVSTGKVLVPDLTGKPEAEARDALMKLTFRLAPTYVDSGGEPGTILRMDYVGQSVPQGSEIRATVVRATPQPIPTATVTITERPTPPPTQAPAPTPTPAPPVPTAPVPTLVPTTPPGVPAR